MNNREDFIKEIDIYKDETKDKLLKLYEYNNIENKLRLFDQDIEELINKVLNDIFNPLGFFKEPVVPFSFFKTVIGKEILAAMTDMENRTFTINELIELTKTKERKEGYTFQYISQEIKIGRIKAYKKFNRWIIPYKEVKMFLKAKNIIE